MAASEWPITISFDSKNRRFTVVLPKEVRDLEIAPQANTTAVVFAAPHLFEIWPAPSWVDHIRQSRGDLLELTRRAIAELEEHVS